MNEQANFCNQCGSIINSDVKFCSNCGCDLKNSSTKTSLDANIKLETANVKLETTNATLEKGFKEVRKGLLLSTERVMGFSFKSGLTRIWIFLSVLYLIFATVALIENIEQYANIGTMVGNMLGGLILLWLVPYILIFWIGRGLYWALCWIKTGFIADPSNKPDQSKIRTKEEE